MFSFHKSLNASQTAKRCGAFFFRKAHNPDKAFNDLDSYLKDLGDEPIKLLTGAVQSWSKFSCDELTAAIESDRLDELLDWQGRWAKVINELLAPLWTKAVIVAAKNSTGGKMILADSNEFVRGWVDTHGGELLTQLSAESRKAITNVVLRGQSLEYSPRQIAAEVRPLIGLTDRQAQANAKYKDRVYQTYLDNRMSEAKARERSEEAALRYAGKQHRYRAETIILTELAHAYNNGAHIGVRRAISNGLMGRCEMIWTTAGRNRICARCMELKDTVVGHTDESGVKLPPLHPRCRCTIMYREIEPPKSFTVSLPRGLSAGNRTIDFYEGGKSPYLIGNIDFNDEAQVRQAIDWFESIAVNAPVENALIITTTGDVYHCSGGLNTLDTILELGEKLIGAIVTHNHPRDSVNECSFGSDDRNLFAEFNLRILRGIDEKFIYEFNRDSIEVDDESTASLYPRGYFVHIRNIKVARFGKYSYRRWIR